jgi:hypothetical protein
MDQLKTELGQTNDPVWLVFVGSDKIEVGNQLVAARSMLEHAKDAEEVASFNLPTGFWPRPDYAAKNRTKAAALARRSDEFVTAVKEAGFTSDATMLAKSVFDSWRSLGNRAEDEWPDNPTARWLVSQFAAHTFDGQWLALGIVHTGSRFSRDSTNF